MGNNIIFRISGRTTGGLIPIVNIGGMSYGVNDQPRYSGKKYFTVRNLQEHTLYTIHYPRIVSSTGRAGLWVMELGIPRNYSIVSVTSGNYMSVFDLLQYLSDCLLNTYMTNEGNGDYRYDNSEIDKDTFQKIIDGYNVKFIPRKTTYMLSDIKEPYATLIVSNETQIKDLFDDTNYEEFSQYSEVIVALDGSGQSLASSTILSGISIPRPVNYKIYVNDKYVKSVIGKDTPVDVKILNPKPHHQHTPLRFTINNVENNSNNVKVNHIQEEVRCRIEEYGIDYKCLLVKNDDYKYSGNTSADFVIEIFGDVDQLNLNDFRLKDKNGRYATESLKANGAFCLHGDEIGATWELEYRGIGDYRVKSHTLQIGKSKSARVEVEEYNPNIYVYLVNSGKKYPHEQNQNSHIIEINGNGKVDVKGFVLVQNNCRLQVQHDAGDHFFVIPPAQQDDLRWRIEHNQQQINSTIDLSRKVNKVQINTQKPKPPVPSTPNLQNQWTNTPAQTAETTKLEIFFTDSYNCNYEYIDIILYNSTRSITLKTRCKSGDIISFPNSQDWLNGDYDNFDVRSSNYHIDTYTSNNQRSDYKCEFERKSLWERINKLQLAVAILSVLFVILFVLYIFALTSKPKEVSSETIGDATQTESLAEATPSKGAKESPQQYTTPEESDETVPEDPDIAKRSQLERDVAALIKTVDPYSSVTRENKTWKQVLYVMDWVKDNKKELDRLSVDYAKLAAFIKYCNDIPAKYAAYYNMFDKQNLTYTKIHGAHNWYIKTNWTGPYEEYSTKKLSKRITAYRALQAAFKNSNNGNSVITALGEIDHNYLNSSHKDMILYLCAQDSKMLFIRWIDSKRIQTSNDKFLENLAFVYNQVKEGVEPN